MGYDYNYTEQNEGVIRPKVRTLFRTVHLCGQRNCCIFLLMIIERMPRSHTEDHVCFNYPI